MAVNRRQYRKTMVENVGKQFVDVTLAALVRFHAETEQDQADLLALLSTDLNQRQIEMILPRWGTCQPLQCMYLDINKWGDGEFDQPPTLTATLTFDQPGPMWTAGELFDPDGKLPLALGDSLIGQPLEKLMVHPYLPRDMPITDFALNPKRGWIAKFHDASKPKA